MTDKALQRRQLDTYLQKQRSLAENQRPSSGWVKTIRKALGMTHAQLAQRVGESRQAVRELEQSEAGKRITLERLEALASALGCRLTYALVPLAGSTESTRRNQACQLADNLLSQTRHSMGLEAQSPTDSELENQRERLVEKLLRDNSSALWR
jgi:predicted DNA-binding mobile mystery protein A